MGIERGSFHPDEGMLKDQTGAKKKAGELMRALHQSFEIKEGLVNPENPAEKPQPSAPSSDATTSSTNTQDASIPKGDRGVPGVERVPVGQLPEVPDIHGPQDFQKVSMGEMQQGLQRWQQMRPAIESGNGNTSDYWREKDQQLGLNYENGYQKIFDSFYGTTRIKVVSDGNQITDIINGRHRIWLAKQMNIDSLPVTVKKGPGTPQ